MNPLERDIILRAFIAEAEEQLTVIEEAFMILESDPDPSESLNVAIRLCHNLKGAAGLVGFESIEAFLHRLEELIRKLLDRKIEISGEVVTLCLNAVDAIRDMIGDAGNGITEIAPQHQELMEKVANASPLSRTQERDNWIQAEAILKRRQRRFGRRREDLIEWLEKPKSLRVDIDIFDDVIRLAVATVRRQGQLRRLVDKEELASNEVPKLLEESGQLLEDLLTRLIGLRTIPIRTFFSQYRRTVRDASRSLGKKARLALPADNIQIDTKLSEELKGVLTHLIRNALDHGLEPPEERAELGKDPTGTITLSAKKTGNSIQILVSDDGRGFSTERICEKAIELKLIGENESLPKSKLFEFAAHPGLSTSESETNLSGRGLGLNIAIQLVDNLSGSISLESEPGKGSTFRLDIPTTFTESSL